MIALTLLNGVTKVIAHGRESGPCADGLAAALIVRSVLPTVAVEFVRYESPELATMPAEPGLLFLDIAPPPERAAEFLAAGALVFDHHASMEAVTRQFMEVGRGIYATPDERGISAATLAFRSLWEPLVSFQFGKHGDPRVIDRVACDEDRVAFFAQLVGIYDTWKKEDPFFERARELVAVLYFFSAEDWLSETHDLFAEDGVLQRRMELGSSIVRERTARSLDLVAGAERFVSPKGTRVAVCASSEVSEAAEMIEEVDIVVGFAFRVRDRKPSMKLSFRSRGDFEVRPIAEALGGGGHAHAASAWVELGAHRHPYAMIRTLMSVW